MSSGGGGGGGGSNRLASLLPKVGVKVNPADFCYFDKGEDYLGIDNRTKDGIACLQWKTSNHRFCRNPSNLLKDRPWCFTDKLGGFGYCNIQPCAVPSSQTSSILYTIIPCLLFALILSLAIITLAWKKHKDHYYEATPDAPKQLVPRVNPKILEINREDLCDFRMLGDGNIGRVYTADYTGSKDGRTFTACVAVKAIIEKASNQQIQDFVREAETRANFKHENVIALLGVISKEEPLSLIYEYTEFGDLHEYLLRHSPNFSDAHAADNCGPLEFQDLFAIAKQIASGMSYLSSHAFVHRDLAARNCLIAEQGMVKISDFSGLCDMYAGDYYRAPGRPPLPVRWLSPEAISELNFSTSSDVWSFGVLLWEIFSYGSRPFFGCSNYQAMELIMDDFDELLPCPDRCPDPIYDIIATDCWQVAPEERATFPEIYNKLKSMNDLVVASAPSVHGDSVSNGIIQNGALDGPGSERLASSTLEKKHRHHHHHGQYSPEMSISSSSHRSRSHGNHRPSTGFSHSSHNPHEQDMPLLPNDFDATLDPDDIDGDDMRHSSPLHIGGGNSITTPSSTRKQPPQQHHHPLQQRDGPIGSYRSSLRHGSSNPSVHSVGYHPATSSIHSSSMASGSNRHPRPHQQQNYNQQHNNRPYNTSSLRSNGSYHRQKNIHHSLPRDDDGFHSLGRPSVISNSDHHSQSSYGGSGHPHHQKMNNKNHHHNQQQQHYQMQNMNNYAMGDHRSTISSSIVSSATSSNHHRMAQLKQQHPAYNMPSNNANRHPSYPPSLTGPPASSVFSRQSTTGSSKASGGSNKSYESPPHNEAIPLPPLHHSDGYHHHGNAVNDGAHYHGNGNAQVYL